MEILNVAGNIEWLALSLVKGETTSRNKLGSNTCEVATAQGRYCAGQCAGHEDGLSFALSIVLWADQRPCALYPHVEEVLAELRARGHALAVATSKSRRGLVQVLANVGWQDFFDGSRCADETRSKPDPMMLLELIDEFGVGAEQVLMIGDTEFDVQMAVNAGVSSVAVTYGAHSRQRLLRQQPLACIDCFSELLDWV